TEDVNVRRRCSTTEPHHTGLLSPQHVAADRSRPWRAPLTSGARIEPPYAPLLTALQGEPVWPCGAGGDRQHRPVSQCDPAPPAGPPRQPRVKSVPPPK